jgi:competence protein ComEC
MTTAANGVAPPATGGGAGATAALLRPHRRPTGQLPVLLSRRVARGPAASIAAALAERRLFVLLPFAAIAGLTASLAGVVDPDLLLLAGVGAAIAIALPLLLVLGRAIQLPSLLAAFWLGFSLLGIHGALFGTPMLDRPAYGIYEARIDRVLSEIDSGRRVIISAIAPAGAGRALPVRRARIVIADGPDLAPGDTIRGPIRFYPVPGPVVPGGFDTQFHAYFDGIGAYGTSTAAVERVREGDAATPERLIDGLRRAIGARIDVALEQPQAGIARALIIGDQSALSQEARRTMATAGLAHVLAISGLHLTMVAGSVLIVLRLALAPFDRLARHISAKRVAAVGGIVAALAYFSISGGSVAAMRATVMIVLVFGAIIVGRRALTMRNVAFAALLVLLTDPTSVFRPSFQLSFAAVVALIGVWELARPNAPRGRGFLRQMTTYFWGLAATSIVAGAATLLFSIYHFQQTAPLGVVGNLLSLPLVGTVLMPAALVGTLLMPFGLEALPLGAMGWAVGVVLSVATQVAAWSEGLGASPLLTPSALLLGLAAFAWFAFFTDRWRLLGPVLLVPAVLLVALDRPPDVIIADSTQAVAMRTEAGLQVIAGQPRSFAVAVWREAYGEALEPAPIRCDSIACIGHSAAGFSLAIVRDPAGFYEECATDLVIARRVAPASCGAGTVIDAASLERGGVHWLRWRPERGDFEVRPAMPDLSRPWRVAR